MKKSHIYIAKSILNRFSYRDKDKKMFVCSIDFEKNIIEENTTSSFNIGEGYFSGENEENLKRFSEEKIGNVIAYLQKQQEADDFHFMIPQKMKKIIKKYICYQLIRDDTMVEYIKEYFLNIDINQNYLSNEKLINLYRTKNFLKEISINELKNILIENEEETNVFFKSVLNLGIIIRFNNTNREFVLTSSTSALNPYSEEYFIMSITLTPKISIDLCKKDNLKDIIEIGDDFYITEIKDEESVIQYNRRLYETAKRNKPHIIVGCRNELEELMKE